MYIKELINSFKEVAHECESTVLYQVMSHFNSKLADESKFRTFMPKGGLAKIFVTENTQNNPSNELIASYEQVVQTCKDALEKIYSSREPLGKVYLPENMANYNIPFSQRSASKAMKTIIRGSRLPVKKDIVRLFTYWKDPEEKCVDVDLSATMYNENWNNIGHISYTNVRGCFNSVHSGDIIDAPEGASEYVDINIPVCKENGVRYVVVSIHSFRGIPYSKYTCFAGYMEREEGQRGEIFEPTTAKNRFDLSSNATQCIPMIFDIIEKKMIWADVAIPRNIKAPNCIESNWTSTTIVCKGIVESKKASLLELFTAHVNARGGQVVPNPEEADLVFTDEPDIEGLKEGAKIVTPFDFDVIVGEFL